MKTLKSSIGVFSFLCWVSKMSHRSISSCSGTWSKPICIKKPIKFGNSNLRPADNLQSEMPWMNLKHGEFKNNLSWVTTIQWAETPHWSRNGKIWWLKSVTTWRWSCQSDKVSTRRGSSPKFKITRKSSVFSMQLCSNSTKFKENGFILSQSSWEGLFHQSREDGETLMKITETSWTILPEILMLLKFQQLQDFYKHSQQ